MPRIAVGVRLKPEEVHSRSRDLRIVGPSSLECAVGGIKQLFDFDYIFPDTVTQETVFNTSTKAIIDEVLEGFNGCVLTCKSTRCRGAQR
jgi:Kinesin motor domain